jgi:hypothetical protein
MVISNGSAMLFLLKRICMKFITLSLLYSLSSLAQDYTLHRFENDHFRDYTREQLMERMGENSALLPEYSCNGRDEFDPFWPAVRENTSADSFTISIYKTDELITYKKGQYFKPNGEMQRDLSNVFVAHAVAALEKIEAIPEGAFLLRQLEKSHFPVTLTFGGNSFSPVDDEGRSFYGIYRANALSIFSYGRMTSEKVPFNNIGAGGTIRWNPKTEGLPPHVALAHEMYHAFDSIRGVLDMRFVKGENYEFSMLSEYRAVYFENIARKGDSGPGVLDENGEPRKMPSPCLN